MISFVFSFFMISASLAQSPDLNPPPPKPDKNLQCTEKGCICEGADCNFQDHRLVKNPSTVAITCKDPKCGQKIVFTLRDKYGCKSSVQKMKEQEFIAMADCLILENSETYNCPDSTSTEIVEDYLKICLEIFKNQKSKNKN